MCTNNSNSFFIQFCLCYWMWCKSMSHKGFLNLLCYP
jgi:hypothetical protein